MWTRTIRGQKTRGRQLAAGEVEKVRHELERYAEFAAVSEQIVEVSLVPLRRVQARAGAPGRGARRGRGDDVPGADHDDRPRRAAGPFAKAAGLLDDLAGVQLTAKRVERAAEASGTAMAAADRGRPAAITARKLVPLPPDPLPDRQCAAWRRPGPCSRAANCAGPGRLGLLRAGRLPLAGREWWCLGAGSAGSG